MGLQFYKENEKILDKKLKKCQVCGGKAFIEYRGEMAKHWLDDQVWFWVVCSCCKAKTEEFEGSETYNKVIKAWNEDNVIVTLKNIIGRWSKK